MTEPPDLIHPTDPAGEQPAAADRGERSTARRQLVAGGVLGAGVVLVAALLLIANYFGWKYHHRFDWTKERLYTLSDKSRSTVAALDKDIEAVVFMRPSEALYGPVRELLQRYEAASPRLKVRYVDPEKNLAEAQRLVEKYQLQNLNLVVFDDGRERRVIESADLADYDYSGMQFGQEPTMTGFKGEQRFTGALLELQESRKPKILFSTGHGEADLDDAFGARGLGQAQDLLGRDNFEVEAWASLGQAAVPAGTDLLVLAGPTSRFVEPELQAFAAYLASGGRMLVLLDPTLSPAGGLLDTGLQAFLAEYGVRVGDDIVVDPSSTLPFFGPETIFVSRYGDHAITKALGQAQLSIILPLARSVAKGDAAGYEVAELLRTSEAGWGETGLENLRAVAKDERDLAGPVVLGVAVTAAGSADEPAGEPGEVAQEGAGALAEAEAAEAAKPAMRLVVYGDSDFATNGQLVNADNATLLAETLGWLVERAHGVGIPAKQPEQVRLTLTQGQLSAVLWLTLALLPGSAIVAGIAVFVRRRR
jgi:ABC-type uncharacterized transport system involved in gliding motility auxiliary subunit